jgi:hypothetical protein
MKSKRTRSIAIATLLALFSLLGSPTAAHDVTGSDPNDSESTDTRRVLYRHGDGLTMLKVEFHDPVSRPQLTYPSTVLWQLWTTGGSQVDFTVEYYYIPDLKGFYCIIYDSDGKEVRRVEATKRPATIKCSFRSRNVSGIAEKFVVDAYHQGHMDFAPNSGAFHHRH